MRVVFLGSGAFGLPTLERLCERHRVVGVVTQPDRPAGRGSKLTPTPVGAWAETHLGTAPLFKPERVNEPGVRDAVRALECDAWVVIAFGQKLGRPLLEDRFAINLHASLLPRWRGAAPINHAILCGDAVTGNSVITLADRMDAGLILGRSRREIEPDRTAGELHDLLARDGPDLVERVLGEHASGTLNPIEQDETLVTLAGKLSKQDGRLDLTRPADEVRRRINGLSPWPGVTAWLDGQALRLLQAEPGTPVSPSTPCGAVTDAESGLVACGQGSTVRIVLVQPAGKKPMSFASFANGRRIAAGRMLSGETPAGDAT